MKELWDQLGYENLAFTQQNLRDQAARLGKTLGRVTEAMCDQIGTRRTERSQIIKAEREHNLCGNEQNQDQGNQVADMNLHNTDLHELSSTMECDLLNSAEQILLSVSNTFGDFTERNVDTYPHKGKTN